MEKDFTNLYPNKAELLTLLTKSNFRSFTECDYYAWAGASSNNNPLICETEEYSIVIDGNIINMLYHEDPYGGQLYSLTDGL
jgi:hypothetical protein